MTTANTERTDCNICIWPRLLTGWLQSTWGGRETRCSQQRLHDKMAAGMHAGKKKQ